MKSAHASERRHRQPKKVEKIPLTGFVLPLDNRGPHKCSAIPTSGSRGVMDDLTPHLAFSRQDIIDASEHGVLRIKMAFSATFKGRSVVAVLRSAPRTAHLIAFVCRSSSRPATPWNASPPVRPRSSQALGGHRHHVVNASGFPRSKLGRLFCSCTMIVKPIASPAEQSDPRVIDALACSHATTSPTG
jgi:hypothetical protein